MSLRSKLLQASRSTAFWLWTSLTSLLLAGCGAPPTPATAAEEEERPPAEIRLELPDANSASQLAIIGEGLERLTLGESAPEALQAFPMPRGAYRASRLPDGLPKLDQGELNVDGWEAPSDAFGLIVKDGQVVLALRTWDNVDPTRWDEMLQAYDSMPADRVVDVDTEPVRYRFLESGQERLMLVRAPDSRGRLSISIALGLAPLMNALRMDRDHAAKDAATAVVALESASD